jgi:pSer/pThr/pTyr-binding forkhead associated (FHA) protein
MAKLTLTFKGTTLQSQTIDKPSFIIGRDEGNDLQIDSLAVAPQHASITTDGLERVIKQMDPDYPLVINGVRTTEHVLQDGDSIGVGKHAVIYSKGVAEAPALKGFNREIQPGFKSTSASSEASLQVLKGKNIGVVIPLRRGMTRLGKEGSGSAVIAHRKEGFFLSNLVESETVQVNNNSIQEHSVLLQHGDILKVGDNLMQFFCETHTVN